MNTTLLKFQKNEITEYHVYYNLAKTIKGKNKKVIEEISGDELRHYNFLKKYSGVDVIPNWLKIFWLFIMGKTIGLTFTLKFMEKGEANAEKEYIKLRRTIKNIDAIIKDEESHEKELIAIIEEEKLGYISSMVLGLNDAIVELTGALAGFTFALQNTKVIGVAGLITGIAGALSMSAAEYLSQKSEKTNRNPLKAAFYTGIMYLIVILILVLPYFIVNSYYSAFGFTFIGVILVVLLFSFFVSIIQESIFKHIFWEMLLICLGVSFIAFLIGLGARKILNINI